MGSLINEDPWSLIARAIEARAGEKPDLRAQVTAQAANGKSWTGVPVEVVESRQGRYLVLAQVDDEKLSYIKADAVVAIEVENMKLMEAYLKFPWMKDSKFASMSKLQASRELESLSKSSGRFQFVAAWDSIPADVKEETNGSIVAWAQLLKEQLDELNKDPMGKEALQTIQIFEIRLDSSGMKAQKSESKFVIELELKPENFRKPEIAKLLNSNL